MKQNVALEKMVKKFQVAEEFAKRVNSETSGVATNDYNRAELFNKYLVSIVTDPDYSIFIPTKQVEFGDITFHMNELELPPAFLRATVA